MILKVPAYPNTYKVFALLPFTYHTKDTLI